MADTESDRRAECVAALDEANERMGAALTWIRDHYPEVYAEAVAALSAGGDHEAE